MFGNQKIFKTRIFTSLLALLTAGLLSACGGAAGDATPNGINYSGLTTQAVLTSDNDDAYGTAMLEGGSANGEIKNQIPFFSITGNAATESSKTHIALMEVLAAEIRANIEQRSSQDTSAHATALGAILNGDCGGSVDGSGSESGGTITFNNYCQGDDTFSMTLNGVITYSISGTYDNNDFEIKVNYDRVTATINDGTETVTHTFSGTITMTFTDGIFKVTFTSYFDREGKVFMVEDLVVSGGSISGRLYHPDYGYVDIETTDLFNVNAKKQYCDGTLRITAVDADGNSVYSDITVNADCSQYTIYYSGDNTTTTVNWY